MEILKLIQSDARTLPMSAYVAAGLSGLANTAVLAVINIASQDPQDSDRSFFFLIVFIDVILIYILLLRYAFDTTCHVFEQAIHGVRTRLVEKIRNSQLEAVEHLGRSRIHNCLVDETQSISAAQMPLVAAFQSLLLVVFVTLYIAWISIPAFLVSLGVNLAGTFYYYVKSNQARATIQAAIDERVSFVDTSMQISDGFKEVRLNHARAEDLVKDSTDRSDRLRQLTVETNDFYNRTYIYSQNVFYFLMAVIVFLLPRFVPTYSESLIELTAAILFLIGPLGMVVGTIPLLTKVNVSARNIISLEERLDRLNGGKGKQAPHKDLSEFSQIELAGLEYGYKNEDGQVVFGVGPMNLKIRKGELVFVVGGNGSGKSTFMKLLSGLYLPDRGSIRVDRQMIGENNIQDYRELYSIIFTDFHLFRRLYGMKDVDEDQVNSLLKLMLLDHKTNMENDQFTNIDLSTGQRKRLAMIVAWLEQRPFFIFDEWAADQDPQFREFFYRELLQEFKNQGKTVIAVSHDDRYFDVADRVLKMESGRIIEETS